MNAERLKKLVSQMSDGDCVRFYFDYEGDCAQMVLDSIEICDVDEDTHEIKFYFEKL